MNQQLLDHTVPIAVGQVVVSPELKTDCIIVDVFSDDKVRLHNLSGDPLDVSMWARRNGQPDEIARALCHKMDVVDDLNRSHNKTSDQLNETAEKLARVQHELSQTTIQKGNQERKHKEKVAELEKELGKFRRDAVDVESMKREMSIITAEKNELKKQLAQMTKSHNRYMSLYNAMQDADTRIRAQDTPIQVVTISDHVDTAPQDAKIAALRSDGWIMTDVSYKPTWLYDEDGSSRTVSHTMRYIMFERARPADPLDDEEDTIELPQGIDAAIAEAIGKNDGSHIMNLTAPVEEIADAAFKPAPQETALALPLRKWQADILDIQASIAEQGVEDTKFAMNVAAHQAAVLAAEGGES